MTTSHWTFAGVLGIALALTACGNSGADNATGSGTGATPEASLPTGRLKAPSEAFAYFITPSDGETVSGPITVRFGLDGMGIAPAGIHKDGTGHHHLLVNVDDIDPSRPLPSDDQHIHFGGGQTQTTLDLPKGTHTLQMIMGDWKHQPHDPIVSSEPITITVE